MSGRIKITPHIFYHPTYTDSQSGFRNRVEGSRERKTEHAAQCSKMKLMVCVSVKTWILEGGYITGMVSTERGVPAAHISEGHMVSQGHSLWVLEGLGKGLMLHKCLSEKDISCKNHCWEFCAFFFPQGQIRVTSKGFQNLSFRTACLLHNDNPFSRCPDRATLSF